MTKREERERGGKYDRESVKEGGIGITLRIVFLAHPRKGKDRIIRGEKLLIQWTDDEQSDDAAAKIIHEKQKGMELLATNPKAKEGWKGIKGLPSIVDSKQQETGSSYANLWKERRLIGKPVNPPPCFSSSRLLLILFGADNVRSSDQSQVF